VPITCDEVRRIALDLPEAVEVDHHGFPSFRVAGKIFCTIHLEQPRVMVKLTRENQDNLVAGHPGAVEPVPGSWGRKGSTFIWREQADAALISMLLKLAWANVAPKRLTKAAP
jgi:hypothetical protein